MQLSDDKYFYSTLNAPSPHLASFWCHAPLRATPGVSSSDTRDFWLRFPIPAHTILTSLTHAVLLNRTKKREGDFHRIHSVMNLSANACRLLAFSPFQRPLFVFIPLECSALSLLRQRESCTCKAHEFYIDLCYAFSANSAQGKRKKSQAARLGCQIVYSLSNGNQTRWGKFPSIIFN